MSNLTSIEPFRKLVRLTSRAFYGDIGVNEWRFRNTKDNKETSIADVVLNTLTRYEWVKEIELEKALKVRVGQLQPTLFFLKKEKLVKCEQKREPVEVVRRLHAGATADAQHDAREGDEKTELIYRTDFRYTYWCLDYGQVYNVASYKIFCLKKQLKDKLDSMNRMQEFSCPNCNERYTALNASRLFSDDGKNVLSDNYHGQLVVESDKLVAQATGNADNNVNCCEKLEEMLQKMEEQIIPLAKQLNRVKELVVPEFEALEAREVETKTAFIEQGKIDPVSYHIEQMKHVMQRINSSNKKSKLDITSEPSNNEKSSQDNQLHVPYHAAGLEVQGGQNTKKPQDPSNVNILGQPTSSDHQLSVNPLTGSYMWQSKRIVTSRSSGNEKNSQEHDSNKPQDPSNVNILGQPTTTTLDCHVGMKREHRVDNIREVATRSGIIEEYCKVDLHIQTEDDNNDEWELVEHNLMPQFCRIL